MLTRSDVPSRIIGALTYKMTDEQRQRLLEAVNVLIRHPAASALLDSMLAVANLARVHPIVLTGEAAQLNELMRLRNSDEEAYDRVMALVEAKRKEAGYEPLVRPVSDRFDKTEYMRQFMDKKRERQRRAAGIENMMRPDRDKLIGRNRLEFMDRQSAKWKTELDGRLERARQAQGGRLSKETLNNVRDQFWKHVDDELDQLEELARTEMTKAPKGKLLQDTSLTQLQQVLRADPYE